MAQRIHNLSKWRYIAEGTSWFFSNPKRRTVILDVNCPDAVQFYIVQDRADVEANPERLMDLAAGRSPGFPEPEIDNLKVVDHDGVVRTPNTVLSFVGRVVGRDTLEFAVDGAFELVPYGGAAYVFSTDGQFIATRIAAPVIFTRIANRRQRNPHLEMIEYQQRLNMNRMQAQMEAEIERRVSAVERRMETYAPQRDQRTPAAQLRAKAVLPAASSLDGTEPEDGNGDEPPVGPKGKSPEGGDVPGKRKKVTAPSISE